MEYTNKIINADAAQGLAKLPDGIAHTCVTSPPYYALRDYGHDGQIGLEETPTEYINKLVEVFRQVRRVLRDDGTLWVNIGDSYCGYKGDNYGVNTASSQLQSNSKVPQAHNVGKPIGAIKPKDLIGIPWLLAFALRDDGWYLRQDIIWHKPNPMPESVTDRCTKAHEYVFLLSKSKQYAYDHGEIREEQSPGTIDDLLRRSVTDNKGTHGGTRTDLSRDRAEYVPLDGKRNRRSVWSVNTKPYKGAHFAVFPEELIAPCILAGSPEGGLVLDPFMGSGTTAYVAKKLGRKYVGTEINADYLPLIEQRVNSIPTSMFGGTA